jgi:hypothetical protein
LPTQRPTSASSPRPTLAQTETYDRLVPMLDAAHREMTELSKKKQDGVVNKLKITMINRLLSELGKVIENDPSHTFVDMGQREVESTTLMHLLGQLSNRDDPFTAPTYVHTGGSFRGHDTHPEA